MLSLSGYSSNFNNLQYSSLVFTYHNLETSKYRKFNRKSIEKGSIDCNLLQSHFFFSSQFKLICWWRCDWWEQNWLKLWVYCYIKFYILLPLQAWLIFFKHQINSQRALKESRFLLTLKILVFAEKKLEHLV